MRAITLHEPWATLIAIGAKRFETRDWDVEKPGWWIAIHAGKTVSANTIYSEPFRSILAMHGITKLDDFRPGHVLAVAFLSKMHKTEDIRSSLSAEELAFGDYSPGRFAWEFSKVIRLPHPVEARGYQRIWNWSPEDASAAQFVKSIIHPEFKPLETDHGTR